MGGQVPLRETKDTISTASISYSGPNASELIEKITWLGDKPLPLTLCFTPWGPLSPTLIQTVETVQPTAGHASVRLNSVQKLVMRAVEEAPISLRMGLKSDYVKWNAYTGASRRMNREVIVRST